MKEVAIENGYRVTIESTNKIPRRELKIYFKTEEMLLP